MILIQYFQLPSTEMHRQPVLLFCSLIIVAIGHRDVCCPLTASCAWSERLLGTLSHAESVQNSSLECNYRKSKGLS